MRRILIAIVIIILAVGVWWGLRAKPSSANQNAAAQNSADQPKAETEKVLGMRLGPVQTGADKNSPQPAPQSGNDSIVTAIERGFQSASKEMNEKLDTLLGRTNKIDGKVDLLHGKVDGLDKRLAALESCNPKCKPGTAAAKSTARPSGSKSAAAQPKAPAKKPVPAAAPPAAAAVVAAAKPAEPAAEEHHRRAADWRTPWAPGVTDGNTFFAQAAAGQDQQIQYQPAAVQKKGKSNCGSPCR